MSSRPARREVKACGVVYVRLVNLPAHLWQCGERADEGLSPFLPMQIYLLIEDDRQGPFTPEEIAEKIKAGECTPDTLAWKEGMEEWQPLKDVCELPAAPPPVSETTASKPVMAIRERALQRLRKRRHLKGLKGGCFLFCVGSVVCLFGFLLCLTGIGAILGVPLIIVGMGISYVAAPAVGVALGRSKKAKRVSRGPSPSTATGSAPEDEPSALPQPSAPLSLPEMPAINPAVVKGGINAFLEFFRDYKGLFQRIKSSPLPQPAQWYDRYPVVFPAAFLAFFVFGLGLIPLWLTSRLSGGDKGRLSVIAAWPLYLAMLPAIWPLVVLLLLLLPLVTFVMMWVKQWFTPAVRYVITAVIALGFVGFIGLVVIVAVNGSASSGEPRFTASTQKKREAVSSDNQQGQERLSKEEKAAGLYLTQSGYLAAVSKEAMASAASFQIAGDSEALASLMESGQVIRLKPGVKVQLMETHVFSGLVEIRAFGTTGNLWTNAEAIAQ